MLPLTVFGRFWMPKEGLSSHAFSGLLQVAIAMAFDIAEFTHLIVEQPELHNDRTVVTLVLIFTSTSVLLLVQIDVGMASDNKLSEIIWTLLTILFLDGPFFGLRVYVASEYSAEDLQLVFLLKNLFGIIFGGYRVVSLLTAKEKKSEGEGDGTVDVTGEGIGLRPVVPQPHLGSVQLPENYVFEMYANKTCTVIDVDKSDKGETYDPGSENATVLADQVLRDDGGVVILNEAFVLGDAEVSCDSPTDEERHEITDLEHDQEITPDEDQPSEPVPGEEDLGIVHLHKNYVLEMFVNKTPLDVDKSDTEETSDPGSEKATVPDDQTLRFDGAVVIPNETVISSEADVTFDSHMDEERHEVTDHQHDQEVTPEEDQPSEPAHSEDQGTDRN